MDPAGPPTEPPGPRAWRIEFSAEAGHAAPPLATFRQPRVAFAHAQPREIAAVLEGPPVAGTGEAVELIILPAGSATPFDLQKRAEEWMASRAGEHGAPIEIFYRSERLLWRPGRALCFGTPEHSDEVLAAVAQFAFCEGELCRLERQMADAWPVLETDVPLTHGLHRRDLARQPHVNAMTRHAKGMRIAFVRLQTALETPAQDLAGPARRLFAELALQAAAVERLRALDDSIEVAEDIYELAGDRLSEFSYFAQEYRIEIVIVVVLLAELLVTSYEFLY
ncbi:MAG: hypothetical protein HY246_22035 [Proteobacteria bacterium]|nr:hypothetical protein [Pseudomonadota bacterium]